MIANHIAWIARRGRALALPAVAAIMLSSPGTAWAVPLPPVDRVGFEPRAGAALPRDAVFADESGRSARLASYLHGRPAIVVPAYYGCSNLCTTTLRATRAALDAAGLRAGRDVEVVAISIAPLETPALAHAKKREVLGASADAPDDGWHFLTGTDAAIARVTRALGYRYAYAADERQYAHAAGIAIAAPSGRIARVLYGVSFSPRDLRAALASATPITTSTSTAAGEGGDAPPTWLLCFHYDPKSGRYTFAAMSAVRAAGLLVLAGLAGYATLAWRRERRGARGRGAR